MKFFISILFLWVAMSLPAQKLPLVYKVPRALGASRATSINIARKLSSTQSLLKLPKLDLASSMSIKGFKGLTPVGKISIPQLPWRNTFDVTSLKTYRGLALKTEGNAVRNILENGLRLEDVGRFSADFASTSGPIGPAIILSGAKFNNLTDDPAKAADYAKERLTKSEDEIAVVVEVNGIEPKPVIHYPNDIPASQISGMVALLNWGGVPTWCKIELAGDDGYKITPYTFAAHRALRAQIATQKDEILKGYELPANYIEGYMTRRIEPYLPTPIKRYGMGKENPDTLYRGMLLTIDELNAILEKGFSPKDATWNAGTDGRKAVSFSSSSVEASDYIFESGPKDHAIGVVFEVKNSPKYILSADEKLNSTKTIYYSYEDVPADEIVKVYVQGEYGLESISNILQKIKEGKIRQNTWTSAFDRVFLR